MEMPRLPGFFGPLMVACLFVGFFTIVAGLIYGVWWLVTHISFVS
jgi:hypothetical protein